MVMAVNFTVNERQPLASLIFKRIGCAEPKFGHKLTSRMITLALTKHRIEISIDLVAIKL
jgi:hypothetical protein